MRRVYNLTPATEIEFYGRLIPPNGGYTDIPQLNEFIPNRDRRLEQDRMISFDKLPQWFLDKRRMDEEAKQKVPEQKIVVKEELEALMVLEQETTYLRPNKRK